MFICFRIKFKSIAIILAYVGKKEVHYEGYCIMAALVDHDGLIRGQVAGNSGILS